MSKIAKCDDSPLPHAKYGVDLKKEPDTYVEPFTAYRAWNWTAKGITSLNGALWTPKVAFEAVCQHAEDLRKIKEDPKWHGDALFPMTHLVPDPDCTCGMYAGINMQHLIDIGYIQYGIHGEVSLWGRLMRHTLGWRAEMAYPKYFVVPMNMIPFKMDEAKQRLDTLAEFGVDIYLQQGKKAQVEQEKIPLWIADYGYSQQGISMLAEKCQSWYKDNPKMHRLAVGDRVAVFSHMQSSSGIGIVQELSGDDMFYTMFNPNHVLRKPIKGVRWNEKNWRWETTGVGSVRRID